MQEDDDSVQYSELHIKKHLQMYLQIHLSLSKTLYYLSNINNYISLYFNILIL